MQGNCNEENGATPKQRSSRILSFSEYQKSIKYKHKKRCALQTLVVIHNTQQIGD